MAKTIAFFVRNIDAEKYPFSVRDLYYHSYQEYLLAMKRAGARAVFVTGNDSYRGDGRFRRSWTVDRVSEVEDFVPSGEIMADLVFEKGGFLGRDVPIATDPRLYPVISDKTEIYRRFSRFQPQSEVVMTPAGVAAATERMPGDMVVVKNPVSAGGRQVYIGRKGSWLVPEAETYPLLVQEFVDMSDGVPGLVKGPHDIRVLMTGSTIIGATMRVPAEGGLYANVSKGASERLLSVQEIPFEVKQMAAEIDSELEDWPRYYAIDFARGKQGWVLIEINARPGLFREANGPLARVFADRVAEYLVDLP